MRASPKRRFLYSTRALLASAVLYFALDLSRGDRGTIDYVVVALIVAAIAWNVGNLGRRMYAAGGGKGLWAVQRTVLFWIIGLMNTVWLRPEDVGTWKNWGGWFILALAVVDTVALWRSERRVISGANQPPSDQPA